MSDQISIQEIVEAAIEIEKNGVTFYEALAGSSSTERVKDLFSYLAEQEALHIVKFQDILDSVGGYQISEAYYATQYMGYMKALADEYVFRGDISPGEVASRAKSPREAIDIAIGFEKESIIFLHEMRELMPDSGEEAVQKLLDEEREHLRRLSNIKAEIDL